MPRKQTARRFVPRYPVVTQFAVDEEAKYLAREIENLLLLSANDVRSMTDERYQQATLAWTALREELARLPALDVEALRAVLFRDVFHTIECCRSSIRLRTPEGVARIIPDPARVERDAKFNEWLFERAEAFHQRKEVFVPERTFPLGQVVITAHAKDVLHPEDVEASLLRHHACDWGELSEDDRHENELSLVQGLRLFSAYQDRNKTKFWIITEADRSATTILLPDDY